MRNVALAGAVSQVMPCKEFSKGEGQYTVLFEYRSLGSRGHPAWPIPSALRIDGHRPITSCSAICALVKP